MDTIYCVVGLKGDEGKLMPMRRGIVVKENDDKTFFVKPLGNCYFPEGNYKLEELVPKGEIIMVDFAKLNQMSSNV